MTLMMFIVNDKNSVLSQNDIHYMILLPTRPIYNIDYSSASIGSDLSVTATTSTLVTLTYNYPYQNVTFDPAVFEFAPIYLS